MVLAELHPRLPYVHSVAIVPARASEDCIHTYMHTYIYKGDFKQDAEWLKNLEEIYCPQATPRNYTTTRLTLDKAIQKLNLSKSLGPDKISPYWLKNLTGYRYALACQFNITVHNDQPLLYDLAVLTQYCYLKARKLILQRTID